jgi:hypothetical protein
MRIDSLLFLAIGVLAIGLSLSAIRGYGNSWAIGSRLDQDDSWTVIEYPEGQEVAVELKAGASMPEAKASARVMRSGGETAVNLDVSGATGSEATHQVYIVDSLGNATLLGTLTIADGAGTLSAKTALSKFMIVVSPESDLTAIGPETKISLRSAVPEGFAVIPREAKTETANVEPTVNVEPTTINVETPAQPGPPEYDVPLLDIASLKRGGNMRVKLSSGFENGKASAVVKPQKNGPTQITIRLTKLKDAPEGTQYILWQVAADKSYTQLGHLAPAARNGEFFVNAETSASDFGLLITFENANATQPAGSLVATVIR